MGISVRNVADGYGLATEGCGTREVALAVGELQALIAGEASPAEGLNVNAGLRGGGGCCLGGDCCGCGDGGCCPGGALDYCAAVDV